MGEDRYNRKLVFAAACIGMLMFGMVMISLGSILPEITKKFDLNELSTGAVITLLPTGVLLASIVFGPLIDWLAFKSILIVGSLVTILGIWGLVISDVLVLLNLAVFLIGLGAGFLNGVTNSLVSEISLENRSANLSFLGVFYGIGALGTPALFGVLEGLYSFETIFTWIAVLMMFPLIFFISIRFPKSAGVEGFSVKAGVRMVADPLILLFGFILFFQSGIEGIAINWTTTFLDKAKEIEIATALFMLSGFVAALTFVRILLIRLLRVYVPINVMFLSFYLALIGCVLVITTSYTVFVTIGMLLIGAGMACGFPVILGYVGQIYTKLSGTAFSIVITIALIGNVVANYLMGLVSEKFGIGLMPYLLLLCMLVVLGLLYVVNNKYKHALFSSAK